ncbi:Hsp20/alpha crystallin family protein [Luteimicrobium sp. NPDC057192]|uniref:Hsp20/alpha crystallin family protein n=1 Tax=Luteimicrobium sp. NPDC057192 TaxID=3346042 RepID=UPI003626E7AB
MSEEHSPMASLEEGVDALRRDLADAGPIKSLRARTPTTDVYTQDDRTLVVEVHLPHFREEEVEVGVEHDALVIRARRERKSDDGKKYVVRETGYNYYRSVALPRSADEAGITARFGHGVLRVTVPLTHPAVRNVPLSSDTT